MKFPDLYNKLLFDDQGLIPAIVQDVKSNQVLMMAYMNAESLKQTIETGYTWFYSRSRKRLWNKGETSGNKQKVVGLSYDCDGDCLLVKVKQHGVACHTGSFSCFHNSILPEKIDQGNLGFEEVLQGVYRVIKERQANMPEGSYTTYLFKEGQDKILKKIGEEASEIIIASKNEAQAEITYEVGDFIYHLLVLLVYHGLTLEDLALELNKRR